MRIVDYVKSAEREFLALPRALRLRVSAKVMCLAGDPFPAGSRKLAGHADLYRLRCGDYRVLYHVEPSGGRVTIARVCHRKDAYRNL